MEDKMLEIIDHLDSNDITEISTGLELLDVLLRSLLPYIKTYSKLKSKRTSLQPQRIPQELNTFIELQDNFQYNITEHLLNIYKLNPIEVNYDTFLITNRLLQGLLLIHSNSRQLFHRQRNMKLILDLLLISEDINIELTISIITTLIHILLKDFINYRIFENLNGCSILIKKFKLTSFDNLTKDQTVNTTSISIDQKNLNFKIIEFLMFYLTDENVPGNDNSTNIKSIKDKSNYFKQDFPEIDDLIQSLNELKDL